MQLPAAELALGACPLSPFRPGVQPASTANALDHGNAPVPWALNGMDIKI